ncbi:MAG: ligase-associated DNA damage response endonuclease PdeM [Saprospiraceae bacterium]
MLTSLAGQEVELLPQKALFLPSTRSLLIADMHVGKAMHFRKSGMPLPADASERDFEVLAGIIRTHAPQEVIFLGDLFHSHQNVEWNALQSFLNEHSGIRFALVPGNHDRFSASFRAESRLELLTEQYPWGPFVLSHAPLETPLPGFYQLCGHLHPGVALEGKARMRTTLPCFWLGAQTGVLPAFGNLTGLALVSPKPGDRVVVIADGICIEV